MSDNNPTFQDLYKALKADGAVQGDWNSFRKYVGAPGKQGYLNRKKLYDALKADGAVSSPTYEDFHRKLYAAGKAQLQRNNAAKVQQQPSQPQTTAQKAMALQQQSKQQKQVVNPDNVDYLSRPKATPYATPKKKEPKGKVSAFVQGLYDQEDMQREQETHQPITYTSKGAFKQMAGNRKNAQQQAMNAAVTQATGEEAARRNQPIVKTETPADDYVVKTEGQLEDEVAKSAEGFVNNNMANYISDAVKKEQDASLERAVAAADRVPAAAGLAGGMSLMSKGRSFNEQLDTDAMAKRLVKSVSDNVQTLFSNPEYAKKIEDEAVRLGISTDAYIQSIVPSLQEKLASQLTQSEYMKSLPTNTAEYFLETALDANSLGKYIRMAVQTKGQRIAHEQAMAQTREGKNPNYKPGIVTDVAANVLGMSTDPIFRGAAGMGGKASKAAFGNVASKIANSGNIFQKAGYIAGSGVVSGGVTGTFFGAHNAVLENYSTGDDTSLGNTLRLAATGALSEGASWSLMGLMGAPLNVTGRKVGLTGAERTTSQYLKAGTAKVSLAAGSTIMEALGMNVGGYAAARIEGQKDADGNPVKLELVNGTLETLPTVIGFRLAHAKDLFSSRKGKDGKKLPWYQSAGLNLHDALLSDETKSASLKFTDDEKQQLFGSGAKLGLTAKGKDIFKFGKETKKFNPEDVEMAEDGSDLLNYYQQMMLDPNVSWDAKNKFSAAVMGVFSNSRPMRDYVTFTVERVGEGEQDLKKYVNEYAKDGTLISKTSYDSNEARGVILYRQNAMYEHNRLYNAWGVAIGKDSEDREMQRQFLLEKGYDVNNNPENTSRNMELIADMNDKESDLYKEFMGYVRENGTAGKVTKTLAEQFGTKEDTIEKAIFKDPMKRTELENNIAIAYRRALEAETFPSNKPHEEQSHLQGKDVAEDNNLGTEQPNSQAVIDELNNLKEAEDNLTKAMESNDTFKQIFEDGKKQGMRNADIYATLLQNGVTADEAAPLAEYMNANARVQGMQQATQQKIEQNVSAFVDDWAFKGTYNGEKIDGKNVIRVQDEYGRVLIVANGDMSFDETNGKAKEGVGDLLICYDENSKQTVYAKVEDVTLFSNEDAEAYKVKEIERLQNINSVPYNEAARAQAEADAAKTQQEGGGESKPQGQGEAGKGDNAVKPEPKEKIITHVDPSGYNNATHNPIITLEGGEQGASGNGENPPAEEPKKEPMKFKDGTDVPMKQDSKGRPAPDYDKMTPAQSAEVLHSQFKGSAEKVADARIKKAKEAVKKAEKIKVNYDAEDDADILEQETAKTEAIKAAQENLEKAEAVKKALTALQVDETLHPKNEGEEGKDEGRENPPTQANVASPEAAAKFQNTKRLQGYKRRRTLKDGTKVYGHYEIVPAESLTPSHDVFNGYKMSAGFPVDKNGHTINDRDYEHDKDAQNDTDLMARTYDGQAIDHVPTVSDEGIVYDGNGRTMAGQKAAKEGTDADYIEALMENAESFGFTKEQIEQSGIEHPRLAMVTDERLPYDTATFAKFNQNERKTQSNTEKAVAKAKTLTSDEIGAIVAEVEGTGSLEAFFNNPKAINDLIKTLQEKKVLGHNEVAELLENEGTLSAQGKEYVKNLLLGSVFSPETIRMMGIDSKIKTKAVHGIRAIMDNMKLGEYSLRDEIDNAIKLFYEARDNGMTVDDLLRQSNMYDENARDRFSLIEQAIAQTFEGNNALFRDLMREYNDVAKARNTGEGDMFGENQTRDELIDEFINKSKTIKDNDIKLYGKEERAEGEGADNATGNEKLAGETGEGAGEKTESQQQVDEAVKSIATEITKGTGVEVVTGEEAQEALDEAEANGTEIKKQRISAKGAVLDWGNIPKKARLSNDELTSIIMWNNSSYAGELDHLKEGEYIEHYVDANGYFYTFRVDKNHHIYMDEAIPKTSSANKERINELKNYYNEERARHLEAVRSDRSETQSELGRPTDSYGSTIGGRNSQDSAVGRGNEGSDSKGNVERDTSRSKQSSSKIKQFRSKDGEVYGFTDGEKIYLDTKKMKPETPLHEYTHLWTAALKRANPKEWENVKKIFDEVEGLKEEVQKLYPELKGDDLYEEMITTYSGREGAKKLETVARELAAKYGKTVTESAKAQGFLDKVKTALQKYWKGVADMLHIHFTTAEEVADKVLADLAKGVNPNEIKGAEKKEEPSKDPIEGLKKAAEKYRIEHEEKVSSEQRTRLGVAQEHFDKAKKKGNPEEVTKAAKELKAALDDVMKSEGKPLAQRRKEIAAYVGKEEANIIDKPFKEMDSEEREFVANQKPLTEDEIRNNTSEENKNFIEDAVDYINGKHGFAQKIAYLKIYEDVRNRQENAADNSGAKDRTQLAAAGNEGGEGMELGTGRDGGGTAEQLDNGTGGESAPGERGSGESGKDDPTLSAGEQGDKQGEGNTPGLGTVSAGNTDTKGSGAAGTNGTKPKRSGRASGAGPAKPNAKRKPAAKQGTTWKGRSGEEIKKNVADKKAAALAAIAELKKRRGGTLGMNAILTPEQMEYVPTVMNAIKDYGMAVIDQGIYKIKDWFNHIRETFGESLKDCGFSDNDIDEFIVEMWNSKMEMDGDAQYSKTDTKDVKNSRIIPEDVDKNVSSQIEKRFDEAVERVYGRELTPEEQNEVERIANRYRNTPLNDEYTRDKNGNRKNRGGLETAIKTWEEQATAFENYYGITRGTKLANTETWESGRLDGVSGVSSKSRGERRAVERDRMGYGNIPAEAIKDYQGFITNLAAAKRALEYHQERTRVLTEQYGVKHDEWLKPETIDKIFNDYNADKSVQEIYNRIKEQVNGLGIYYGETYGGEKNVDGFYRHSLNDIRINLDRLVAFGRTKQDIASTILHEMLHPLTSDIIAMYQKGHTDKLTSAQREAAKETVDIFNELKQMQADGKIDNHYALTNAREMITELSSPEWRNALAKIPEGKNLWQRFVNAVRKMLGFDPKYNKLGTLTNTLDKLLTNFGKEQFDFATRHTNELFDKQASKKVFIEELDDEENRKLFDSPIVSISDDAPAVVKHIDSVSRKTGAKVNIITSAEEVTNKQAKAAIGAGKKVTGWYDEKTGQVHLYMPNIHDSYTAEKTIWHETVGHKGMRELFGDKFDKFLDSVWYDLDRPENAKLKELVMDELKKNPFDYRNAIEEGVARLAEEGKGEPGFWRNIKNKMVDLMHEVGYRIAPNTKDVKYLLWLSKNLQKHPNDVSWRLKADAVKYKLDKENAPEVITRDGIFRDNDGKTHSSDLAGMPKKEYQEATDGQVHFRTAPSLGTAIDRYHRALNAHGYMATESFMDNMLSLDKLMRAIDPSIKKIEDVESSRNPYILQNTMQGAMSNAAEQFEMHVMKPLDKAMADLLGAFDGRKTDDMIRNFNLYMITKHGLERNRVFFVRDYIKGLEEADAKSLQRQWNAEKKDLGDKLNNGSIDLKSYYDEMDEWIRNNVDKDYDASENDYSGLHGVQGIKDGKQPYDDAAAIDSVMSAEAKMEGIKTGSVKDFWSKVRTATDFALGSDYKNGIVSKDNHDNVSAMFDWYVPLRKFDKDTAEDVYGYITEKGNPSTYIGSTLMNAKGRKSLSETNVLAQIGAMGNAAINRGGQNAIKKAFMRFIRANSGNGLVTESKVWAVYDGTDASGNPIWREAYPDIPEDAAPDEIAKIVSDFETDMKAKQAIGDAKVIRNHRDVKFKFERAKDANQHVVDVMVNGSTVRFYVNGNPRAAQALNGMLENQGTIWLKPVASITRTMAQLCTSYSPEFVVRNIVRDAEFAFSNIAAKENSSYRRTWEKYYVGLIGKGIGSISFGDLKGSEGLGLYAKYNNGTLDMSNKVHRYFKEFMENGGETGWVQVLSMKDWEKKYKTDVKTERSKINKGGEMLKDFFLGNLKNINEATENMARFATYCASRDAGRSAVRSAYDAKEVSTNFNRHGSGDRIWDFKNGQMSSGKAARQKTYGFLASYLRQCSMFFNAGIQSTNLLMKNYKHTAKGTATVMTGIPFAMGIAAALVNNWLIASEDEKERKGAKDPYGELPEYVRRNNLCIYKGNGEFVTIPLAIELRAFYGVGDLAAGLTFSKNIKTTRPAWADAVGCLSQLVPIMDYTNSHTVDNSPFNETLKAFSPSAFAPLVEWGLNSDWKGAPIRREKTSYNEYAPAWTRAYKNTPKVFMDMNKKANAMTNDLDKGNENLLGWNALDAGTDPSAWNHFLGGFGGGMTTFATRVTKLATSLTDGQKPETSDIPFVRSFLYEPNEQSSIARTKSKWYNYIEDMKKDMSNIQTLKKRTVPVDQLVHNYAAYYKIKNSPKAQMAQVIEQAESQMKQLKQMRDKSSDPAAIDNANKMIDNIMMRAVEQLDQLSSVE